MVSAPTGETPMVPGDPLSGRRVCGAKGRRSGNPCQRAPMANGRCYMHGGATPRGYALPQTTTGRYSKALPERLAARFEAARTDRDLLSLRDEIALVDARLGEVLATLDTGESQSAWAALSTMWAGFSTSWQDMTAGDLEQFIAQVGTVLQRGTSERGTWDEALKLVRQRAELVANERQRLVQLQQMVTTEQAMVMLGNVLATIKRHVSDRAALAAISADFAVLATNGQQQAGAPA